MADRDVKGRVAHGETHYAAKLTNSQVAEIRGRFRFRDQGPDSGVALAREFKVTKAAISNIIRDRRRLHG